MSPCPDTPQSEHFDALGFVRRPMVDWLNPVQLVSTGIKSVLSGIFGQYADKRELQAVLHWDQSFFDYSQHEELWVDFAADMGDGWDATYTVAKCLAASGLPVSCGGVTYETRRGHILVLGGDEVYPTATRIEYRDRFIGPYTAALPYVNEEEEQAPHVFAIPGNHDWYDGLTAFTRLFAQRRWLGGWQTHQLRSYFALKLPHNWWLWGIDVQLEADFDKPQLDYFDHIAQKFMHPGDKVILCTAQPDWVTTQTGEPDAYRNLAFFEDRFIHRYGGRIWLTLTGDLHHYCRYQDAHGTRHKITAGGGGAYLYPTHQQPQHLELREGNTKVAYTKAATFPDEKTSSALTRGVLRLPWKNRAFALLLGLIYLVYFWIILNASLMSNESLAPFLHEVHERAFNIAGLGYILGTFFKLLIDSPTSLVFSLLIVYGMYAFCSAQLWYVKLVGAVHGVAHVISIIVLAWLLGSLNFRVFAMQPGTPAHFFVFTGEMLIVGSFWGGLLMGLYLYLGSRFLGLNSNEAFSAQRIADYKHFIRLYMDKTGNVTLYPIGITEVCKKWRLNTEAKDGASWFEPADGNTIQPHLIEEPILVRQPAEKVGAV